MLDLLSVDLGPYLILVAVVTAVIGTALYALYKGINRLIAFLERHDG